MGLHSIKTAQIPSSVPISYFPSPIPPILLPFYARSCLPSASCLTERKTVEIQTIILIHETSAFVMRFRNRSRVESGAKCPRCCCSRWCSQKNNVIGQHNHSSRFRPIPSLGRTDRIYTKTKFFCLIKCLLEVRHKIPTGAKYFVNVNGISRSCAQGEM